MKKLKKAVILIFLTILLIFLNITPIQATEDQSMELALSTNKSSYKIGDELYVDVNIKQINGFSGVNTFVAKKVYDSEVLEYIETTVNENWKVVGDGTKIVLRKNERRRYIKRENMYIEI